MVLQRNRLSFALSTILLLAAALGIFWYLTGGPLAKVSHESSAPLASLNPAANPAGATDKAVSDLQAKLRQNPDYADGYSQLGGAYLQKARETADPSFYAKAEGVLRKAIELDPQNFSAIEGMGSLALSRHQFREALQYGQQVLQLNSYSAAAYGIVGDAHIELGEYPQAVEAFQKMVDIKPDLAAYSRVSYARELNGDLDGALDAMLHAAKLGAGGGENEAWTLVQVGNLYFNRGDLSNAEHYYQQSVYQYQNYPHGLAGLANVRAAQGKYADAIKLYQQVTTTLPLPQYVITLGDIQTLAGHPAEAIRTYDLADVEDQLFNSAGVNSDVEIALYDVDHGRNLTTVLQQARQGEQDRPSVKGDDVLAWTLYKTGNLQEAQTYIAKALRLGSKDPIILFHAAEISYAAGDHATALQRLDQVMALNPHFSFLYQQEAANLMKQLKSEQAGGKS